MSRSLRILATAAIVLGGWLRLHQVPAQNADLASWWQYAGWTTAHPWSALYEQGVAAWGPIWPMVVRGLAPWCPDPLSLGYAMTMVLTLIDVTLALSLPPLAAILVALNPVSIVVSGSLMQWDCLAILFGWWAWRGWCGTTAWPLVAVYLAASLLTKHSLIWFLPWVLLLPVRSWPVRLGMLGLTGAICCAVLAPFVLGHWFDFRRLVIGYRSWYGTGLVPQLLGWPPFACPSQIPMVIWIGALTILGVIYRVHTPRVVGGFTALGLWSDRPWNPLLALPVYLVAFLALAPSIAGQYLALAVLPLALMPGIGALWAATLVAWATLAPLGAELGGSRTTVQAVLACALLPVLVRSP